ncbi:hypothetical protein AGMMS49546_34130 [Spirochaetia bacterium]|nr:hypothetical protein AGMMS49546_34130 [Spirochaetia bacterium]
MGGGEGGEGGRGGGGGREGGGGEGRANSLQYKELRAMLGMEEKQYAV